MAKAKNTEQKNEQEQATHIATAPFRAEFLGQVYHPGDDVSHLDEETLQKMVKHGAVKENTAG